MNKTKKNNIFFYNNYSSSLDTPLEANTSVHRVRSHQGSTKRASWLKHSFVFLLEGNGERFGKRKTGNKSSSSVSPERLPDKRGKDFHVVWGGIKRILEKEKGSSVIGLSSTHDLRLNSSDKGLFS